MEKIKELLKSDIFFQGKKYTLQPIQNWNRSNKFLVEINKKKYTLIIGKEKIEKLLKRFNAFGDYFKELIGFQYMNEDHTILLYDYFGNGEGKILSNCSYNDKTNELIADQLKKILDNIHSHKKKFINVSTRFQCTSWYDFIASYMKAYADYALKEKDLSEEDYKFIFDTLKKNKPYFDTISLNYLHGDINEDNVCFNENNQEVYLIDYDDVIIGDSLYEYARMFQYEHIKAFKIIKEKYFENIDNNIIFNIYFLRDYLLEYCGKKHNGLNYENDSKLYHSVIEKLKQLTYNQN